MKCITNLWVYRLDLAEKFLVESNSLWALSHKHTAGGSAEALNNNEHFYPLSFLCLCYSWYTHLIYADFRHEVESTGFEIIITLNLTLLWDDLCKK